MKAANPSSSTMAVDREFLQNHLARDIVNFFHFSLDFGHMMDLDLKWSKMVSDWTSFDTTWFSVTNLNSVLCQDFRWFVRFVVPPQYFIVPLFFWPLSKQRTQWAKLWSMSSSATRNLKYYQVELFELPSTVLASTKFSVMLARCFSTDWWFSYVLRIE